MFQRIQSVSEYLSGEQFLSCPLNNKVKHEQVLFKYLSEQLIPRLKQKRKLSTTIFEQDGASAHVSVCAKAVIQANFGD